MPDLTPQEREALDNATALAGRLIQKVFFHHRDDICARTHGEENPDVVRRSALIGARMLVKELHLVLSTEAITRFLEDDAQAGLDS